MALLIWIGTAITLAGLGGLVWCIIDATRSKRAGLDDAALKARLQRLVVYNMVALFVSAIGLMAVVAGVMLA